MDAGNITLEDLLTTFPFYNTFDLVTISGTLQRKIYFWGQISPYKDDLLKTSLLLSGKIIREAFEHSVYKMTTR